MKTELLDMPGDYEVFNKISETVYRDNPFYRGTELSIEKMLVKGRTAFRRHADIKSFIILDNDHYVGRFTLIHDSKLSGYIQVAFFEALPGLSNVLKLVRQEIERHFPGQHKMVVGLNGHLNYGAGLLLSRFDEPPLFGLPYTPPYYPAYFSELGERRMVSFRFNVADYLSWVRALTGKRSVPGLTVRVMDKRNIREETKKYTYLNNVAFKTHPYWADRTAQEDFELFHPFRHLLNNEHLIFAEVDGEPVGFLLWYPDFNQLVRSHRDLNISDIVHFRLWNRIDTFRYTEVGIHPDFRKTMVLPALMQKGAPFVEKAGYKHLEAGFIFEENADSTAMAIRMYERFTGVKPEPYRKFAVYEGRV